MVSLTIEQKTKEIGNKLGLVFYCSHCPHGGSSGAVASKLIEKNLITHEEKTKLLLIGKQGNFWENYWRDEPFNSQAILFINLVYKIISKKL